MNNIPVLIRSPKRYAKEHKEDIHSAEASFTIVLCLILGWLPYFVVTLYQNFQQQEGTNSFQEELPSAKNVASSLCRKLRLYEDY